MRVPIIISPEACILLHSVNTTSLVKMIPYESNLRGRGIRSYRSVTILSISESPQDVRESG